MHLYFFCTGVNLPLSLENLIGVISSYLEFFCTCDSFSHVFPCVFYISTFSSLPKIILLHFQCYTFCSEQIVTDLTRKQVS